MEVEQFYTNEPVIVRTRGLGGLYPLELQVGENKYGALWVEFEPKEDGRQSVTYGIYKDRS